MVRLTIITANTQTAAIRITDIQAIAKPIQGIGILNIIIHMVIITAITKGVIALTVVIDNA